MKAIKNIKQAAANVLDAASSVIVVSTDIVADATDLTVKVIDGAVPTVKAVAHAPIDAAVGYTAEKHSLTEEVARELIEEKFDKSISELIAAGSVSAGAAIAALLEDDKEEEQK